MQARLWQCIHHIIDKLQLNVCSNLAKIGLSMNVKMELDARSSLNLEWLKLAASILNGLISHIQRGIYVGFMYLFTFGIYNIMLDGLTERPAGRHMQNEGYTYVQTELTFSFHVRGRLQQNHDGLLCNQDILDHRPTLATSTVR
jgi:hypothetical protein